MQEEIRGQLGDVLYFHHMRPKDSYRTAGLAASALNPQSPVTRHKLFSLNSSLQEQGLIVAFGPQFPRNLRKRYGSCP